MVDEARNDAFEAWDRLIDHMLANAREARRFLLSSTFPQRIEVLDEIADDLVVARNAILDEAARAVCLGCQRRLPREARRYPIGMEYSESVGGFEHVDARGGRVIACSADAIYLLKVPE